MRLMLTLCLLALTLAACHPTVPPLPRDAAGAPDPCAVHLPDCIIEAQLYREECDDVDLGIGPTVRCSIPVPAICRDCMVRLNCYDDLCPKVIP